MLLSHRRLLMTLRGLLAEPCVSHLKQCWIYFSPFLYQSPPASHTHTSGSWEVKTTFLNQLPSRLFNWKNKWSHVSSASPKLCYDLECQVEQWYAWLLMDSIIWLRSVRLPPWKKCSSRVVAFKDVAISHLTQHLLRIARQNKYTKTIWHSLVLLLL